jgi:AraC-like DNA-binding protein
MNGGLGDADVCLVVPLAADGALAVHWSGAVRPWRGEDGAARVAVHVPLAWVMGWALPRAFTARLLRGDTIEEPDAALLAEDRTLLARWLGDLGGGDPGMLRVVALEVHARLSRLAMSVVASSGDNAVGAGAAAASLVERVVRHVGAHFREPLTVATTAAAVGVHPTQLMRAFKQSCGLSVWEYVVMARLAHAQRLLVETGMPVLDVAMESGFGSAAQFYSAFGRACGMSPARYRAVNAMAHQDCGIAI